MVIVLLLTGPFFSDEGRISVSNPTVGLFHAAVDYYLLTYYDSQRLCELLGAKLATYSQLYAAWKTGLEWCQ